ASEVKMLLEIIASIFILLLLYVWLKPVAPKSLEGNVVLITGGSGGLGRACAFEFHKHGCQVILCSRNLEKLEKVKKELMESGNPSFPDPLVHYLDVSDIYDVESRVDEIVRECGGRVDVLVNNAGVGYRGDVATTMVKVFDDVMKTNFMGQVGVTRGVLPYMRGSGGGHIVGVGSVQAKLAIPNRAAYAASKHAAQAFYDCLRSEVHSDHIHVTVVNPSHINTDLCPLHLIPTHQPTYQPHPHNPNAGDGSAHGKLDDSTARGFPPSYVAREIVAAVRNNRSEITLAPFHHKMAIWIRLILPSLYFKIM
uniref:Dehydrogenase/reductase SDR family member 7B n=1 Tax=Ciona savignyi TaxID=51511 RepID=H2YKI8_CIOSA